jgi:hypothetical protein
VRLAVIRQVLVQGSAAGDVHPLHAAADPEHREIALPRGGVQRELVLVGDTVDAGAEPSRARGAGEAGRALNRAGTRTGWGNPHVHRRVGTVAVVRPVAHPWWR